ncbi:MAG: hypothetical protein NVSMB68_14750 [Thermoanaerobaculia bacterium]
MARIDESVQAASGNTRKVGVRIGPSSGDERVLWRTERSVATEAPADHSANAFVVAIVPWAANQDSLRSADAWVDENLEIEGLSLAEKRLRIVVGKTRALIVSDSPAEPLRAASAAWYVRQQLTFLDEAIRGFWKRAEEDVPLTHSVTRRHLGNVSHVNEMTVKVAELRFRAVELQRFAVGDMLHAEGRRTFLALLEEMDLEDRLEAIDDAVETLQDLYELANDRLTEFTFFNREYRLEWLILLLLLVEVLQIFGEIWFLAR